MRQEQWENWAIKQWAIGHTRVKWDGNKIEIKGRKVVKSSLNVCTIFLLKLYLYLHRPSTITQFFYSKLSPSDISIRKLEVYFRNRNFEENPGRPLKLRDKISAYFPAFQIKNNILTGCLLSVYNINYSVDHSLGAVHKIRGRAVSGNNI